MLGGGAGAAVFVVFGRESFSKAIKPSVYASSHLVVCFRQTRSRSPLLFLFGVSCYFFGSSFLSFIFSSYLLCCLLLLLLPPLFPRPPAPGCGLLAGSFRDSRPISTPSGATRRCARRCRVVCKCYQHHQVSIPIASIISFMYSRHH